MRTTDIFFLLRNWMTMSLLYLQLTVLTVIYYNKLASRINIDMTAWKTIPG